MNERILELYMQAQEFAYKNISKESWNTDNFHAVVSGKFAEAIVRECASMAVDEADKCGEQSSEMAGYRIRQHFGVKE